MEKVDFDRESLQRLREALRVSKDKELAEALGLGEKAFNARKARNSFPVKELYALAAKRPDLKIDVSYVLTGITAEAQALLQAKQERIDQASAAGLSLEQIRAVEAQRDPASLGAIVALLEQCNAVERASVHALLTSVVKLREAFQAAQKAQ